MRIRTIAAATVFGLALTACANASPGSGSTTPSGIAHPTGAGDPVLVVAYEGGFVAPQVTTTRFPQFALYGDGTLITPGAQTEIYPQQALPPIMAQTVDDAGMQAILQAAIDAGLAEAKDMTDMGPVGIADAPTTVFTFNADGVQRTVKIYALGELPGQRPAGMTQVQYESRKQLQQLVVQLGSLDTLVPAGSISAAHPYHADGARLYVGDYQPNLSMDEPAIAWPLSNQPLATFGDPVQSGMMGSRCGVVTGSDWTDTLEPAAAKATQLTPWTDAGAKYSIAFRPLLPDESTC